MKSILLASAAVLALSVAPVSAQIIKNNTETGAAVGGTAGGVTGAIAGGLIFGPIGAVIGGFTGSIIGAEAGVSASSVDYVRMHPTEPVEVQGDIAVGYKVPEKITIHKVEGDEKHGYFYTNDRVYFVDLSNRTVIYSPGTVVAAKK